LRRFVEICSEYNPGYVPDYMYYREYGTITDSQHIVGLVITLNEEKTHSKLVKSLLDSTEPLEPKSDKMKYREYIKIGEYEYQPKAFFSIARVLGTPFQKLVFYQSNQGFLVLQNESHETGVVAPLVKIEKKKEDR